MDEAKLTSEQNKKVEVLLNKFSKCISLSDNDVGKTSTLSHSIKLTRDIAIKQPIRRINGELAEEVETQLQQLSDDGIIRPMWNDDAEKAFNKLKQLLVSPQLLAYPDYNSTKPLEVHVDSSLTGAGAVLSQKQLGVVRPIAFISTSWGVTEQNYASTARELAGLRWAVKKLAPFLRGREFIIHTDNQPLIFLSNTKCVSQRLARTLEDLSDFNFKVKWIPGHSNIVADALSRMHETTLDSPRAKESLNILGESLVEVKMDGGGDSLVNALSFWLTGNFSDSLNLRQKLVTELMNNNKLYGLELNKVGKFELKIMLQEGINLIPEAIKAFSNLFNCKVIVFEKRRHPIEFGDDSLPKICYLNSHNSLHYNLLLENNLNYKQLNSPEPDIAII
ncbi:unnamed protein product, partial [Rotaria magnacalcarata]